MCVYRNQRLMLSVFLKCFPTLIFETKSLMDLELTDSARLGVQKVPGFFCCWFLSAGVIDTCHKGNCHA